MLGYFRKGMVTVMIATLLCAVACAGPGEKAPVPLPPPDTHGSVPLERTLQARRSVRAFDAARPLTLQHVSQLLWAAQGKTHPRGLRTAPSAGATYPLETCLAAVNVTGLAPGIYRYDSARHRLLPIAEAGGTDGKTGTALALALRDRLVAATGGQSWVRGAGAHVFFSAVYSRIRGRYGERGVRYTDLEAGHAAQGLMLEAVALGLGTTAVGAFDDAALRKVFRLPPEETPLYLIPVGHPSPPRG